MKGFRNSKQDIADIEALKNDKDTESSQRHPEFAGFLQQNQIIEGSDKEEGLRTFQSRTSQYSCQDKSEILELGKIP